MKKHVKKKLDVKYFTYFGVFRDFFIKEKICEMLKKSKNGLLCEIFHISRDFSQHFSRPKNCKKCLKMGDFSQKMAFLAYF